MMTENLTKCELKSLDNGEAGSMESRPKKPRTSEDFYLFCKFILEHENYDLIMKQESEYQRKAENGNKRNSSKLSVTAAAAVAAASGDGTSEEMSTDDSYDLVTCFCQKPFAGRPMIECSSCLTWLHLRCVKIKKTEIPDIFICPSCTKRRHS